MSVQRKIAANERLVRLAAFREVSPGLAVLELELVDDDPYPFEPGQFLRLGRVDAEPDEPRARRSYSIASAPGGRTIELFVERIEDGLLTPPLFDLPPGSPLVVGVRAYGRFTLAPVGRDEDVVALATGTGIAPFLSMLRHYAGRARWRRFVLVHGARTRDRLGYEAECTALAEAHPDVRYVPVLSREPLESSWPGLRGHVQVVLARGALEPLAGFPLDPASTHVYLCGNPAMIDDVEQRLATQGFTASARAPRANLHRERYW